jgi:F-type H+-transporting ATPase subunit beta
MPETPAETEKGLTGQVSAVRGSVVDVSFGDRLPSINSLLQSEHDTAIIIEVIDYLNENKVRGIALTPTAGLAR